ncbi:MAG: ankyrin repeat domain-containing protein, partial [Ramlibacter sp.]|nr:ankyrin repeat domain-containing protein [Ramlibacter sp.]
DFFTAIKRDDASTISALLTRGFDPNTPNPERLDGLYLALRESNMKAAQALIDWPKTNVESRSPQDENPLMIAALRGHIDMARKLIARGADVNKPGWTPLHYAATSGHVPLIDLLLENHAYIDAESPNGTTPLMMAAQYGSTEAVKLLLESGADATIKNQLGMTAVDFAQRASRPDAIAFITTKIKAGQPKGKW